MFPIILIFTVSLLLMKAAAVKLKRFSLSLFHATTNWASTFYCHSIPPDVGGQQTPKYIELYNVACDQFAIKRLLPPFKLARANKYKISCLLSHSCPRVSTQLALLLYRRLRSGKKNKSKTSLPAARPAAVCARQRKQKPPKPAAPSTTHDIHYTTHPFSRVSGALTGVR